MMRHLVIFARAPQVGRVKRRLASEIGVLAAGRFYRSILFEQIKRLTKDRRWTIWLFITPDTALNHPAWRRVERRHPQGRHDLGRRMKLPFLSLPPGPVVLVGSDIPAMRPAHIARAFALLGRSDLVFGPATDGGFWLVGAKRVRPLPQTLFTGVRWSTPTTLKETLAGIPRHVSVALADTLDDVDDAAAYWRFRASSSVRSDAKTGAQSPGAGC
ncbi:MAG: TIGR04282 family arsenosugar biosynthesis glycosyltransferase [Reyranella sp.]|uniref:TIGR04282 family arsenosugar biosynthesis glycosyltransferase n=1 Tax=Reyranella sp. TaxID=1929291 RepID=UPI00272F1628|nr:TIGR04282 family arsenosugar biosynthesis glycosyltransferase [Reyranella sp.]MDP1967174.1 TIGR04282 family arsenosugar biosynthesis glycosyltransferase [Reyranella sp.]MDP2373184.1 TIGR04282 family arsenosugar biosynthesis glycosyltransferase [Reyranella sp.]